ncbi:hypothetical protein CJ030_MR6G016534 [Morella rubra]|uniref:Uncharacterized protein n=1 Tax=Morella rubra TaxID=262757 RepID=A0A6A1V9G5_9ROSI|nr:hypothetical protein CJ030_MR6G016534 [Morella rubra]
MVNMVDKMLTIAGNQIVVLKFNEASRAFLAQRCSNKASRFVAISQYGEGHRRGVVMIHEDKEGAGRKELAGIFQVAVNKELRDMIESLKSKTEGENGSSIEDSSEETGGSKENAYISSTRSVTITITED